MKKTSLVVYILAVFLVCHTKPETPYEKSIIDPGMSLSWSGYQTEYHWFNSLDAALEYLNKGQYSNPSIYEAKELSLDKAKVLKREELIKHYEYKYDILKKGD